MYHNEKNRQIWAHAACFIEDKMYFTTNELTGLYSYYGLSGKTEYLKSYMKSEYPEIFPYKFRTIYSYERMLFLFPYFGTQYEIYDTLTEKKILSEKISEGYVCAGVCEMKDKFCILENNSELNERKIRFWNKTDYSLCEWEELSETINQIETTGEGLSFLKEMISIGELLIIGVGETAEYIIANVATGEINVYSLKDCATGIHTISTFDDKVLIVTNDSNIVTLDIAKDIEQKQYSCSVNNKMLKPLFTVISANDKLFALCHYDIALYQLTLNDIKGEYSLQRVIKEEGYEYDMFLSKCPYLDTIIKGDSLFLLPLDSDYMVEYIFSGDYVRKVVHKICINEEHLNSYIESELCNGEYINESNELGKDMVAFINYICDRN